MTSCYLYLPLVALTMPLALGAEWGARRWPELAGQRASCVLTAAALLLAVGAAVVDFARARRWAHLLALFESALRAGAANPESWQLYAAELYRAVRRPEAVAAFERAAALGSTQRGLHSHLCALRRELGDLERAAADCDRPITLGPGDPRPRYNRALLWATQGRTAEAVAELRSILADHSGDAPARAAMAGAP